MRQARSARGVEVGQQRAQQRGAHTPRPLPAAQQRQQLPQHAVALGWRPQPCTPWRPFRHSTIQTSSGSSSLLSFGFELVNF